MTERVSFFPQTGSALCSQHAMEKSIGALFNTAWSAQHLRRCKILLSIPLFLACLFEATLLSHFLGLSHWNLERPLHQFTLTSPHTSMQNRWHLALPGQRNRCLLNYFLEIRVLKMEDYFVRRILNSIRKLKEKYLYIYTRENFYFFCFCYNTTSLRLLVKRLAEILYENGYKNTWKNQLISIFQLLK